jgi:hypothetical protein
MVDVEKIRTGKNGIKEEMRQSYKYMREKYEIRNTK